MPWKSGRRTSTSKTKVAKAARCLGNRDSGLRSPTSRKGCSVPWKSRPSFSPVGRSKPRCLGSGARSIGGGHSSSQRLLNASEIETGRGVRGRETLASRKGCSMPWKLRRETHLFRGVRASRRRVTDGRIIREAVRRWRRLSKELGLGYTATCAKMSRAMRRKDRHE